MQRCFSLWVGVWWFFFLLVKFKDKPQLKVGAATLRSAVTKTDVYVFMLEV